MFGLIVKNDLGIVMLASDTQNKTIRSSGSIFKKHTFLDGTLSRSLENNSRLSHALDIIY